MTYESHLAVIVQSAPDIAGPVSSLRNLDSIIRWIPSAGLSLSHFDSIQQDEYNYDVIFPWSDHRWIAFGVT